MQLLRVIIWGLLLRSTLAFLVRPGRLGLENVVRIAEMRESTRFTTTTTKNSCMTKQERWQNTQMQLIHQPHTSTKRTQLMGLFGLGGLEIAIVCVGVAVVLGPEKIVALVRSTGATAGELKDELSKVPDEFQKGYEEGQIEARSRKAKPTLPVDATVLSNDKFDKS